MLLIFATAGESKAYMLSPKIWASWFLVPLMVGAEVAGTLEFFVHAVLPLCMGTEPMRLLMVANENGRKYGIGIDVKNLKFVMTCLYYGCYYFSFFLLYIMAEWNDGIEDDSDRHHLPVLNILIWYLGPQFFISTFIYCVCALSFVVSHVLWLEANQALRRRARARRRRLRREQREAEQRTRRAARREARRLARLGLHTEPPLGLPEQTVVVLDGTGLGDGIV